MEILINVLGIIGILFLGFCGVFAPMLMPRFVKDEYKDKFPSYMDSVQPPFVYQSRWFKPTGVILQRLALLVWIPALLICLYWLVTGGLQDLKLTKGS